MSSEFLRSLSKIVATHPVFHEAVQNAVMKAIELTLASEFKGETVRIYVPKIGKQERLNRDALVKVEFNGKNHKEVAKKFGISVRQVQRIVKIR